MNYEQLLAAYRRARERGTSLDEINTEIRQTTPFTDFADLERHVKEVFRRQQDAGVLPETDESGEFQINPLQAGLTAFGDYATLGLGDELAGASDALIALIQGQSPKEAFRQGRSQFQQFRRQAGAEHPVANAIGAGAGLLAPVGPAAANIVRLPRAVLAGQGSRVGRGLLTGAAEGGVAGVGFGNVESLGEAAEAGAVGAGVGGLFGAGLGAAIRPLANPASGVGATMAGIRQTVADLPIIHAVVKGVERGRTSFRERLFARNLPRTLSREERRAIGHEMRLLEDAFGRDGLRPYQDYTETLLQQRAVRKINQRRRGRGDAEIEGFAPSSPLDEAIGQRGAVQVGEVADVGTTGPVGPQLLEAGPRVTPPPRGAPVSPQVGPGQQPAGLLGPGAVRTPPPQGPAGLLWSPRVTPPPAPPPPGLPGPQSPAGLLPRGATITPPPAPRLQLPAGAPQRPPFAFLGGPGQPARLRGQAPASPLPQTAPPPPVARAAQGPLARITEPPPVFPMSQNPHITPGGRLSVNARAVALRRGAARQQRVTRESTFPGANKTVAQMSDLELRQAGMNANLALRMDPDNPQAQAWGQVVLDELGRRTGR